MPTNSNMSQEVPEGLQNASEKTHKNSQKWKRPKKGDINWAKKGFEKQME